jgi:RNA polymerase sigma factor (sigma-70 family)
VREYHVVTLKRILWEGNVSVEAALNPTTVMTNWDKETDDKILACVAHGSTEEGQRAFDSFYRRHMEYLHFICYSLVNRYKFPFLDYQDIFQSTMANAFKGGGTFKSDGVQDQEELEDLADAWLGRIAKNVVLDSLRHKISVVPLDPTYLGEDGGDEVPSFEIPEPPPMEETEEIKLIREAIDTLTPAEQAVVWASNQFNECREHQRTPTEELDEIVKRLGISKSNYRKLKQRAYNKIRGFLADRKSAPEAK